MGSGSSVKEVSFEKALAMLRKDVLVMDVHALMQLLGEYMNLKRRFRVDRDLRHEQEATIMMDVCRKELDRRGCFVEEFGDVG